MTGRVRSAAGDTLRQGRSRRFPRLAAAAPRRQGDPTCDRGRPCQLCRGCLSGAARRGDRRFRLPSAGRGPHRRFFMRLRRCAAEEAAGYSPAALDATSFALLGVFAFAGCSTWSFAHARQRRPRALQFAGGAAIGAPAAASFNEALAREYAGLASHLADQDRDWADADSFSRKGLAAGCGQVVVPEEKRNWLVPLEVPLQTRHELSEGRRRLVAALDGGARERRPASAARAGALRLLGRAHGG